MHPNPLYRQTGADVALDTARRRGFGILAVNGADGPLISHVPFMLDAAGAAADLHLVRSNPIARALANGALPAVLAVSGPDAYVSPDWYGAEDQVPTWNYVAVHLRGSLALLPPDSLRDLLDRQSAEFEARLLPKPPWTSAKMDPEALSRMMRQILPVRLRIDATDSTFKLNQNKTAAMRAGAAAGVESAAFGQDTAALAALMRAQD